MQCSERWFATLQHEARADQAVISRGNGDYSCEIDSRVDGQNRNAGERRVGAWQRPGFIARGSAAAGRRQVFGRIPQPEPKVPAARAQKRRHTLRFLLIWVAMIADFCCEKTAGGLRRAVGGRRDVDAQEEALKRERGVAWAIRYDRRLLLLSARNLLHRDGARYSLFPYGMRKLSFVFSKESREIPLESHFTYGTRISSDDRVY